MSRRGAPADSALLRRMLGRMTWRGGAVAGVRAQGVAGLAVAHHDWQRDGNASAPLVVEASGVSIAADATLYYRADLEAALAAAGIRPAGASSAHLILAAYQAWGERCVERLEGDFAFVVWDAGTRTLFCARDFAGSRPLYYADLGHTVVVASSIPAVLDHPACPDDLNLALIAEMAIGQFGVGDESAYAAVSQLPAAHAITFRQHGRAGAAPRRFWTPPELKPYGKVSPGDAARELRELLARAVRERMDDTGPTAIWLSGGRDSTAIFGAGNHAVGDGGGDRLAPVSLSFPLGDTARENEHIQPVLDYWNARGHWIDAGNLPLFGDWARSRDADPYVHPYETANVALVAGARSAGARVALNGMGADILFSLSPSYLADLLWQGRLASFHREWRSKPWRSLRNFNRWVLRPGMPAWLAGAIDRARGRLAIDGFVRPPVPWMSRDAVQRYELDSRQRRWRLGRGRRGAMRRIFERYFTYPFTSRNILELESLGVTRGVEIRRPFLDSRIIEFAARLPWWEKQRGNESKIVLRRAMRGLLPDAALSPKPRRMGSCNAYFAGRLRLVLPEMICRALDGSLLVDLGVVDPAALLRTAEEFAAGRGLGWAGDLQWTLSAEMWLRNRAGLAGEGVEAQWDVTEAA